MLKQFKIYIGNAPWDEVMRRHEERWINKVCWGIIIISVIYIIPISICKIYEAKHERAIAKTVVRESKKSGAVPGFEETSQELAMSKPAKQ